MQRILLLLLLIGGSAFRVSEKPYFVIKPYVQLATQQSIRILWETSEPGVSWVEYGPSLYEAEQPLLTMKAASADTVAMHEIELTGLAVETDYFYRTVTVLQGGDTLISEAVPFKTAVKENTPIGFAVFSDSQKNAPIWGKLTALAAKERPNFAIHGGDLVDYGYVKRNWVEEFFAPAYPFMRSYPIYTIMGNHEHGAPYYYQYLSNPNPEYYYTFTYGNTQFFLFDTDHDVRPGTEVYEWLERELARSTATWKIAMHHHPPFSSDTDDFGETLKGGRSTLGDPDLKDLPPLYEKYGVDVVFYGHIHTYERTWPILNAQPRGDKGVRYINIGGSGGDVEHSAPTRSWFTNKVKTGFHFGYVRIAENVLQFQAIDEDGQVFDAFDLTKGAPWHDVSLARKVPPAPMFSSSSDVFSDELKVTVEGALPGLEIRYTTDGSTPDKRSALYRAPLAFKQSTTLKAVAFSKEGNSRVAEKKFVNQAPFAGASVTPAPGLLYRYAAGTVKSRADFEKLSFSKPAVVKSYDLKEMVHRGEEWGVEFTGYVYVAEDGIYKFSGHAENWLKFYVHDQLLIEEYEQDVTVGGEIALKAGYHPVKIIYYDLRRPPSIDLYIQKTGGKVIPLAEEVLFH
ncbi:metallophosphoesterase [Chitinophaga sp. SYP-B3965]|uniref:metallophosphoesterase n=1 Tax=Chitinophaga sp. SYP-B3965 TaxID=2663120 RepID=UPI001299DF59|nr:metallophosphoesterase [Chitinophaga sp. SYP-B3965]MRG44018.1 metallophosphoesterase [Chitinophaga sp. SYP-B3965]